MTIDKNDNNGYFDQTAGEIFSDSEEVVHRPIIYICSRFSGDVVQNVKAAQRYSRFAVDKGFIPIAPHLLFPQFLDDDNPAERQLGMFFGNALMSKCAEVWVFGNTISSGMAAEIKRAEWKCYRLRYFNEACEEVFR